MTPLQLAVFDFVRDMLSEGQLAPSYSEIQDHLGFRSKAEVARILDALIAAGLLIRTDAKVRNLALPDRGTPDLHGVETNQLQAELERRGAPFRRRAPVEHRAASKPCAAPYCQARVTRGQIYCRTHWSALPVGLRNELLDGFRRADQAAYGEAYRRSSDYLASRS